MSYMLKVYKQLTAFFPLSKKNKRSSRNKVQVIANLVLSQNYPLDDTFNLSYDIQRDRASQENELRKIENRKIADSAAFLLFKKFHTPLICSLAFIGDTSLFLIALKSADDINITVPAGLYYGFTALMMAAFSNNIDILEILLKNGCNIEYIVEVENPNWKGYSALAIAKVKGNYKAECLIKRSSERSP